MPTTILRPDSTIVAGSQGIVGAATDHAALSDVSDASYIVEPSTTHVGLQNFTLPAETAVVGYQVHCRARDQGALDSTLFVGLSHLAPFNPGGAEQTAGGVSVAAGALTASFAQYNGPVRTFGMSQTQLNGLGLGLDMTFLGQGHIADAWVTITYANPPSVTWGTPNGTVTTTRKPLIDWNYVQGTDGPAAQSKFQVRIFSAAQYGIGGFDPATSPASADSGVVSSATTSWVPTVNLNNGTVYRAYVQVYATTNGVDQKSGWVFTSFDIAIPVPVPTAVTPASGSTVTSSKPAVGASVAAMADTIQIRRQWQVASNSGFSTSLQTIDTDTLALSKSGTIAFPAALNRLPQGTWWVRARTVDEYGQTSAYTAGTSFTVAHAPSTSNRQPSGAVSLIYDTVNNDIDVSWTFSDLDPDDFQSRYEAELWKLSDPPGSLKTTGVVVSATPAALFTALNSTWKDTELRWRVRVGDQDSVWSAWSVDQAFFLRDVPVVSITAPTHGGTVTSSVPTFTWTFSATGGRTQASYRVIVTNLDTATVIADSGVLAGTNLSWQVPTPVILVGPNYSVQVITVDSTGLTGSDTNNFTASYVAPTTPIFVLDDSGFEDDGRVIVDWSPSTADATIVSWRIYRRIQGYPTWTLIHEADPSDRTYFDYLCPSQTRVEYAVVQVAISLGDPVESAYPNQEFEAVSTGYFLVCPDDDAFNLKLDHITGETFSDEQEMATLNLIGRGRRVEYGTRYGQTGTLDGAFYDTVEMSARQQRLWLEAIRDSGLKVYLRNPFGDVWAVALLSASVTRIAGTGLVERATYSISYTEITA